MAVITEYLRGKKLKYSPIITNSPYCFLCMKRLFLLSKQDTELFPNKASIHLMINAKEDYPFAAIKIPGRKGKLCIKANCLLMIKRTNDETDHLYRSRGTIKQGRQDHGQQQMCTSKQHTALCLHSSLDCGLEALQISYLLFSIPASS